MLITKNCHPTIFLGVLTQVGTDWVTRLYFSRPHIKRSLATRDYRKARNFRGQLIFVVFADATYSMKFKYFTAHALINHLEWQLRYANNFSMCAYIRYCHTLNWLCLGRLVVTSLRNYLQMHLMFLSNDSLQDPFHAGTYRLVIISIAATHVRLVIFLGIHYSARNYHAANKEVRSTQFASKRYSKRRQ